MSSSKGATSSAACEGVAALKSATKSDIVKSTSCPTAETIGIEELNIDIANSSSLKFHSSSIEPPPLPIIITSTFFFLLKYFFNYPKPC